VSYEGCISPSNRSGLGRWCKAVNMSAAGQHETKRVGALIYLATNRPLHLPAFLDEFHHCWPHLSLEKTGKEPHRALFRAGKSNFAIELHHRPVALDVTESAARSALRWPMANAVLAGHQAHLSVVAESVENDHTLGLSCDLTKAIRALVPVTDALGVCWLNSPTLNSSDGFIETAREMFDAGLYPLVLWVAVRWDPEGGALQTNGMAQFGVPEIYLTHQPDPASLMIDFLFQVAQSVLTSHHTILDGETMDSPCGQLRIEKGGVPGKRILILEPARRG
jgi:hypothetical protein